MSNTFFIITISTLMVPISVILVPAFLSITQIGWNNNLLDAIVPGAAAAMGVFLLRQASRMSLGIAHKRYEIGLSRRFLIKDSDEFDRICRAWKRSQNMKVFGG